MYFYIFHNNYVVASLNVFAEPSVIEFVRIRYSWCERTPEGSSDSIKKASTAVAVYNNIITA